MCTVDLAVDEIKMHLHNTFFLALKYFPTAGSTAYTMLRIPCASVYLKILQL